jgi:hypothetical protein
MAAQRHEENKDECREPKFEISIDINFSVALPLMNHFLTYVEIK